VERVNFQSSRLFWNHGTDKGHGAFKVESVFRFYGVEGDLEETFVLSAGVLAGNMYVPNRLIQNPPYFFQITVSDHRHIIYRTDTIPKQFWKKLFSRRKGNSTFDTPNNNNVFESLEFNLDMEPCTAVFSDYNSIKKHYMEFAEFTCNMVFYLNSGGKIELEFPIKHINISPEKEMFQVETGPVLMIDPHRINNFDKKDLLEALVPSFVHFNQINQADFSIDFPYGIRMSRDRGDFHVESIGCEIQLFSDKKI